MKRIRSILAIEFYLIFSWKKFRDLSFDNDIIKLCIAIELLHSYSLVHDDLPAMDNDIYRRWQLTVWKKFWETNAVLVWDLLNSMSYEIISSIKNSQILSNYFWKAISIKWMIWWQVLDLFYEKNPDKLTLKNLIEVHNKKTGALIEFSIISWILLARLDLKNNIKKFFEFWRKIWLAFQIKDDLLDVEWSFKETWKSVWDWENKWFVYFMW
jgi:geranylgeranyl diphosphate synthase type II